MTLLDQYLPAYDFVEQHAIDIAASADQVMAAAAAYRPEHDAFFRLAIRLRELPNRLVNRIGQQNTSPAPFSFDNFTLLERRGNEEMVYGLAGKFWQLDYGQAPLKDAEAFVTYRTPGAARLALAYSVQVQPNGVARLRTETRVQCLGDEALRKFRPYWYLIRPVSGQIRMRMLKTIRHTALYGA